MSVIYAIPGLGTTAELFQNISVAGYELRILEWPPAQKQFTLSDYAAEFLKQIDSSRPVNLMGVSFGGMLCAELAKKIKTNKVVLISSCPNRHEFPSFLKLLRILPVYRLLSEERLRGLAKYSRRVLGFEKELAPVFFKMVNSMAPNYFSYCIHYIVTWKNEAVPAHLIRIHGDADRLLTPTRVKSSHIIKGGSHAMVLDRAGEINRILNKELNGI